MTKQMYIIRKFDLIGAVLHTYKAVPETEVESYKKHRYYTLSDKPIGYSEDEKFLPFNATVTEDIPGHVLMEPLVYKNCKLMAETHGGYLQFYHEETNQVLRIAMNSHYYTPTN